MTYSVIVLMDSGVGVSAAEFADQWIGDDELAAAGTARVESAGSGVMLPGVLELVVIPLVVNLIASAVYEYVRRAVVAARPVIPAEELEIIVTTDAQGTQTVVVRHRREGSSS